MTDQEPLSPYIAASLRQQKLEAEQRKVLNAVLNELVPGNSVFRTPEAKLSHLRYLRRIKRHDQRKAAVRRARIQGATITGQINRDEIIARDQSICHICGKLCKPQEIHLDHVIPLSKGGVHGPENIKVACATCNVAKGATLLPSPPSATIDE